MTSVEYHRGANEMAESSSVAQEAELPDSMPRSGSRIGRREWLQLAAAGLLTATAGAIFAARDRLSFAMARRMNESSSEIAKKLHKTQSAFSIPMPQGFTCESSCRAFGLEGHSKKVGNTREDEMGRRKPHLVFQYKTTLTAPVPGDDPDAHIAVAFVLVQSDLKGASLPLSWSLTKTDGGRTTAGAAALSAEERGRILRGIDLAMDQLLDVHTAEAEPGSWSEDRHPAFTAFVLSEGKKQLQDSHATVH